MIRILALVLMLIGAGSSVSQNEVTGSAPSLANERAQSSPIIPTETVVEATIAIATLQADLACNDIFLKQCKIIESLLDSARELHGPERLRLLVQIVRTMQNIKEDSRISKRIATPNDVNSSSKEQVERGSAVLELFKAKSIENLGLPVARTHWNRSMEAKGLSHYIKEKKDLFPVGIPMVARFRFSVVSRMTGKYGFTVTCDNCISSQVITHSGDQQKDFQEMFFSCKCSRLIKLFVDGIPVVQASRFLNNDDQNLVGETVANGSVSLAKGFHSCELYLLITPHYCLPDGSLASRVHDQWSNFSLQMLEPDQFDSRVVTPNDMYEIDTK